MSRRVRWADLDGRRRDAMLRRPATSAGPARRESVAPLIEAVRQRGDAALRELTARFDGVRLEAFAVDEGELQRAEGEVSPVRRQALERAVEQLRRFHAAQHVLPVSIETSPGVRCERITRPIGRVGLYAPGGTAPLASTVLMLGVPAQLAGCPRRVLCTPPRADGSVDPHLLVAARLVGLGAGEIFKIGGVQAVAAMAYGTETVPKTDKIFGPGNAWVTLAKLLVSEDPDGAAIDMPAGPSEVLVVADGSADPAFVAADLLSQAEHGVDSHVVLVATDGRLIDAVAQELERQLARLRRREIAAASLENALFVEAATVAEAIAIANAYAPEHLILQVENARAHVDAVECAGSVFLGALSPESMGDYASGTNHVLPTYGFARSYSGLSLDAFRKQITVQELEPAGIADLGPVVETLAELEGLDAHRYAVSVRLERLRAENALPVTPLAPPPSPLTRLARDTVQRLTPYRSARGTVASAPVLLDANESPWSPHPAHPSLHRYPAPQPMTLVSRLASLYEVAPEQLIVGRGTDDVIDWLLRAFCEPGRDGIVVSPPTYGVYGVYATLQGARVREVPLDGGRGFALDVRGILEAIEATDKMVFVCSPNNPTGNLVDVDDVLTLCRRLQDRALVVVDEAYVEFASRPSLAARVRARELDNLVLLRTLSKAYGLAGARCGVGVAHPEVIALLQKVRPPYPLAAPAVEAVLEVLSEDGVAQARARVERLREERGRLAERLAAVPAVREVFPSEANFLLLRLADADAMLRVCRTAGIIVRDRSHELGLAGCVRVTVGSPEENARLLDALTGLAGD